MTCDVIIPAFNSARVLPETLTALFTQDIPKHWQCRLIVSDDGSMDDTVLVAQKIEAPSSWQKNVITGQHAGPGAARNCALEITTAEIIFFLGADILLCPGALREHFMFHEQHPEGEAAALGMVKWDPRLSPTPLMGWMTHGGQQNDFDSLLGSRLADPSHFFYASHLSLKRSLIQNLRFTEHAGYGWEDLAMGRKLEQRGIRLYVLSYAIGLHHHFYTVGDIARRQRSVGENIPVGQIPRRSFLNHVRRACFVLLGGQAFLKWFLVTCSGRYSFPRLFLVFTSNEFWQGVWESHSGFLPFLRGKIRFFL